MESIYLKALGLGIAGFDPSGALIAIAFLAAGATRRAVFLFCVVYLAGTIFLLSFASSFLSSRVPGTSWRVLDDHPQTKAVAELLIGVALITFAVWHHLHESTAKTTKTRTLPVASWATIGTGLLLAAGVVGDPALLAFTVVAATANSLSTIVIAQVIAVLASKILVVIVMVAIALGLENQVTSRIKPWWDRLAPAVGKVVTIVLVAMAIVLIANAAWWFRTATFLLALVPLN